MKCPYCDELDTEVRWTRVPKKHPNQVHRGRRCGGCKRVFTTAEVVRGVEVLASSVTPSAAQAAGREP